MEILKKNYPTNLSRVDVVSDELIKSLNADGFNVTCQTTEDGVKLFINKGDIFRRLVGMKYGIQLSLSISGSNLNCEVRSNVIKDQFIATCLTLFLFTPIVVGQAYGIVMLRKLCRRVDKIISEVLMSNSRRSDKEDIYCVRCGSKCNDSGLYCPVCGCKLSI